MSDAELIFGSLPLLSPGFVDADYTIEALGDGADFGNPEAVIASVASMLMDGDKARINRYGNREVTIPIQIRGANLDIVAAGEAAVMAEVNRGRNTLTWTPPGMTTPSVYDVVYSTFPANKWLDLDELRVTRQFTLKLECAPFPHRAELTTVVATPIPDVDPTWVEIDNCESLTGWSVTGGSISVSMDGGLLAVVADPMSRMRVTRSGLSIPVAASDYIVVLASTDVLAPIISQYVPNLIEVNGMTAQVAAVAPEVPTLHRYYVRVPEGVTSVTSVSLGVSGTYWSGGSSRLTTYDISAVDQLPFDGSRRQRSFTAEVGGTARTSADLIVETEGDALGRDVLIYTARAGGFPPPLRKWFSGTTTPDDSCISGGRHAGPGTYEIPASALPPATYLIMGYQSYQPPGGSGEYEPFVGWSATTDTPLGIDATDQSGSRQVSLSADEFRVVELGVVTLPTVAVDAASDASVILNITASTGLVTDEVWLCNLDDGVLTWLTDLDAGAADPTKVEVRSASLDRPRPSWIAGTAGTDADNISVAERAAAPGVHEFPPGLATIFVVTPEAIEQSVLVEYYESFMHNVTAKAS